MDTPTYRILIAEDDPHMRKFFEILTMDLGADITFVKDGHEALFKLTRDRFDLVILDAVMPRMDGFEVCRMIKGAHPGAGPRVLVVTALGGNAGERAWEAGADDFLSKGMPHFLLHARILHHLSPPPPRQGPLLVATPDPLVKTFLSSQAKQGKFGISVADQISELVGLEAKASVILLDMAFGFKDVKLTLNALPEDLPRVLLFSSEDVPSLEAEFLPINDALKKPLSGLDARTRIKSFMISPGNR